MAKKAVAKKPVKKAAPTKAPAKTSAKVAPKAAAKPAAKAAAKAAPKPAVKAVAKAKPAAKVAPKVTPKTATKVAAKAAPKVAPKATPKETAKAKVAVKPVAVQPEPKAEKTAPLKLVTAELPPDARRLSKAEKATMTEDQILWHELYEKHYADEAKDYKISEAFEAKTPLQHKLFGWGFILSNEFDRLEVIFKDGRRMLISNRKI